MKNISNKNILVASMQPWHSPMISKHFITLELAKLQNNIVFVSLHRIIKDQFNNRYSGHFKYHDIKPDRVKVKKLKVLPGFLQYRLLYRVTKKIIHQTLGHTYYPDIIISFDPQFYILDTIFPNALKIYYCSDHLGNNRVMINAEDKILSVSDLIIAASQRLYDDLRKIHSNVNYIPHGVNLLTEYHDKSLKNKIDNWFKNKKNRPVFGFVGYITSNVDFSLIEYIAKKNPTCMIFLIGMQEPQVKSRIAKLPANVFCPGPVPTIGLKYCFEHFDVGIVPYIWSRYISRSNPIKLLQYIACGLPVVTTEVGEDFKTNKFVSQCTNFEEFNQQLILAYNNNSKELIQQRIQYGKENTWWKRIELLDKRIEGFLRE